MIDTDQYRNAFQTVRQWSRAWIVTHSRADGDSIGSLVATRRILRRYLKDVSAIVFEPVLPRYRFLVADDRLTRWNPALADRADLIDGLIIVDTCARNQLEPLEALLQSLRAPVLVFDHHQTRDLETSLALIDTDASATSLIIAEWAWANDLELDPPALRALFTGIAADTGWFRFANADRRTYQMAARLIQPGVRPVDIYHRLYCSDRPQRLALIGRMFATLELHDRGRCAFAHLTRQMIRDCGAQPGDLEELATEIGRLGSVVTWALLTEMKDGRVRVNLRSKHTIDVARVAEALGGGGHSRAAGARLPGTLENVKDRLLPHLIQPDP